MPPINFSPREAALLVALGNCARQLRWLPFFDGLDAAIDKVRGALTASAQRELIGLVERLQFVGVPAHAIAPPIRRAVEQAWFESQPLKIRYLGADGHVSTRVVRIDSAIFERTVTLLNCDDLDAGARRQFRLDRIEHAELAYS